MADNVTDLADEINRELGDPSDITIPEVAFWLRTNVGMLNTRIGSSYQLDESNNDYFISGAGPTIEEQSIFKELYKCHYFQKQITENLGASAYDALLEVQSDGAFVKTVNKNEVAKTYRNLMNDCEAKIDKLVNGIKFNKADVEALAVHGDDDLTPYPYADEPGVPRRSRL